MKSMGLNSDHLQEDAGSSDSLSIKQPITFFDQLLIAQSSLLSPHMFDLILTSTQEAESLLRGRFLITHINCLQIICISDCLNSRGAIIIINTFV